MTNSFRNLVDDMLACDDPGEFARGFNDELKRGNYVRRRHGEPKDYTGQRLLYIARVHGRKAGDQ